jgi:superfamily II DNA or RNA helicase
MILRNYQQECHDSIIDKWRTHISTLAVLATGLGKTIIFAHIIKTMQPKRALVVAHRAELIYQACDKIERAAGLACEIEMADRMASTNLFHRTPVVVATVQTMKDRLDKFKPTDFGVVVVDEAHHGTSSTYRKIIDHFRQNPELKILGVTATPDRADEEALGQVFESVAFEYDILDGVDHGWLVDVTQQFCMVKSLDFSHVRTTAGDLNGKDLAMVMEAEENIAGVCQPTLEVLHGLTPHSLDRIPVPDWGQFLSGLGKVPRRTIIFTASVVQAEACCNILNRAIPGLAEWVCGATDKATRSDMLKRFENGKTPVVCNCGVLTEGFDNPAVEVIIMARPTKSRSLYAQMVGRSTRPLPGIVDGLSSKEERIAAIKASNKPYCRIIDFVGNSGKHKLMTALDILGGKVSERAVERALKRVKEEGKPVRVCRTLTKEEVDMKREAKELAEKRRREVEARKAALIARAQFTQRDVNPFDRGDIHPVQDRNYEWRGKKTLSEKQRRVLTKRGFDPDKFTFGAAQALIGRIAEKEKWGQPRERTQ